MRSVPQIGGSSSLPYSMLSAGLVGSISFFWVQPVVVPALPRRRPAMSGEARSSMPADPIAAWQPAVAHFVAMMLHASAQPVSGAVLPPVGVPPSGSIPPSPSNRSNAALLSRDPGSTHALHTSAAQAH